MIRLGGWVVRGVESRWGISNEVEKRLVVNICVYIFQNVYVSLEKWFFLCIEEV